MNRVTSLVAAAALLLITALALALTPTARADTRTTPGSTAAQAPEPSITSVTEVERMRVVRWDNVRTLEQLKVIIHAQETAVCSLDAWPPITTSGGGHLWMRATQVLLSGQTAQLFDAPLRGLAVQPSFTDHGYWNAYCWLAHGVLYLLHYDTASLNVNLYPST